MWLCSADSGPLLSPPVRTIGLSMIADTGGWRVAGVIPNSPAEEASIRKDDLVTEIEGRPSQGWTRDELQAWMDTHEEVTLKVATATVEREVHLRVWSLVP
jgi:C-terminal processing protease CtpA/Prc